MSGKDPFDFIYNAANKGPKSFLPHKGKPVAALHPLAGQKTALHMPSAPTEPLTPADHAALGDPAVNPITHIAAPRSAGSVIATLEANDLRTTSVGIPEGVGFPPEAAAKFMGQPYGSGGSLKFVGPEEQINIKDGDRFEIIPRSVLEAMVSRSVEKDAAGRPILTRDEEKIVSAAMTIKRTLNDNPNLSLAQKQAILKRLRSMNYKEAKTLKQKIGAMERETEYLQRLIAVTAELGALVEGPPRLGRADGSMFHKLQEATQGLDFIAPCSTPRPWDDPAIAKTFDDQHQIFVVQHDWAGAFKGAQDFDGGEINLPFLYCAFEFVVNGLRFIVSIARESGIALVCVKTHTAWSVLMSYDWNGRDFICVRPYGIDSTGALRKDTANLDESSVEAHFRLKMSEELEPTMKLCAAQIRAILIALEARVASAEVIRADYKLNAAREKRGKLPLYDYHIVSLARRARTANPLPLDPDRHITRRRLHFRRGHWRHYEKHKVWIEWMLVGDPDLGFIDKEYRL